MMNRIDLMPALLNPLQILFQQFLPIKRGFLPLPALLMRIRLQILNAPPIRLHRAPIMTQPLLLVT